MSDFKRSRKLDLKDILYEVELADLQAFISNYAKKDASFEVALKAHFISRIVVDDNEIKYQKVLGEIIKPKTFAHPKIGPTARKTIVIVLTDFSAQMADLLASGDYREAFFIIKHSLDKVSYLQNKYLLKDKKVELCRTQFHEGLKIILSQNLAPTFRAEIESAMVEIVNTSYYLPKKDDVIIILDDQNVLTEKDKISLIDKLNEKRKHIDDKEDINRTILQLAYPFEKLATIVINKIEHQAVFKGLKQLLEDRKFEIVSFYLDTPAIDFDYNNNVLKCLYYLNKEAYSELSKQLKLTNKENTPLLLIGDLVKSLTPKYLKKELKKIKVWVNTLPCGLKCIIAEKAEDYQELIEIIDAQNDIEWLKVYDLTLIKNGFQEEVKTMYINISNDYLENHIGHKAQEYIGKIETRLKVIGEGKMLWEVKEALHSKFSDRTSLKLF